MAKRLIEVLDIKPGDTLLDVGCSRGFCVRALRENGVEAFGYDISQWAIENCDPTVKSYVSLNLGECEYDFIWSKDTMEHLTPPELKALANTLTARTRKALLLIVPLAKETDGEYVRPEDNLDVTHVIRWTLKDWFQFLWNPDFRIVGTYHIDGLKPTSKSAPQSCGFILLRRTQNDAEPKPV